MISGCEINITWPIDQLTKDLLQTGIDLLK